MSENDASSIKSKSIFELVDSTNEETYHSIGVFESLNAAITAVMDCNGDIAMLGAFAEFHEDCIKLEIRSRKFGEIDGNYDAVWVRRFELKPDAATNLLTWKIIEP